MRTEERCWRQNATSPAMMAFHGTFTAGMIFICGVYALFTMKILHHAVPYVTAGIGSSVVNLIFSIAKREVTFFSGTVAISFL